MYIGSSNPNAQIIEKATVQVAYNAIDEDEISVHVGDVVDVISRVTEDEGWWKVCIRTSII
jgi:RNA-binding protein YlmH